VLQLFQRLDKLELVAALHESCFKPDEPPSMVKMVQLFARVARVCIPHCVDVLSSLGAYKNHSMECTWAVELTSAAARCMAKSWLLRVVSCRVVRGAAIVLGFRNSWELERVSCCRL